MEKWDTGLCKAKNHGLRCRAFKGISYGKAVKKNLVLLAIKSVNSISTAFTHGYARMI